MATPVDHLVGRIDDDDIFRNHKGLLTVKQLAEVLAVSDKALYKWVAAGHIPYVKISAALRFRPAAIREWLREKEFLPAELRRR